MNNNAYIFGQRKEGAKENVLSQERLERIKQNAKFIRSAQADTLKPECPLSESENIFTVHEFHHGEFVPGDIGKPILAFDKPIGLVTIVTDNEIYGIVRTQYYDDWRKHGHFIQVPNVNETSSSNTKG